MRHLPTIKNLYISKPYCKISEILVWPKGKPMDIINTEKLQELYGSEETAMDIIHMFVDRSNQLIADLQKACQSSNSDLLARTCHRGIGQSRYIAAPLLEEALIDLQEAPPLERENHMEIIRSMLQQIAHACS